MIFHLLALELLHLRKCISGRADALASLSVLSASLVSPPLGTGHEAPWRRGSGPGGPSGTSKWSLMCLGHLFWLLVPLPLREDFSSSLQPCRARPQHPLVTLTPCAMNLLPVAPEGPPVHPYSLCLHRFLWGLSASVLFVSLLLSPYSVPLKDTPFHHM